MNKVAEYKKSTEIRPHAEERSSHPFLELFGYLVLGVIMAAMFGAADYVPGTLALRLLLAYSNMDDNNPRITGLFRDDRLNDTCVIAGLLILLSLGAKAFKFI